MIFFKSRNKYKFFIVYIVMMPKFAFKIKSNYLQIMCIHEKINTQVQLNIQMSKRAVYYK